MIIAKQKTTYLFTWALSSVSGTVHLYVFVNFSVPVPPVSAVGFHLGPTAHRATFAVTAERQGGWGWDAEVKEAVTVVIKWNLVKLFVLKTPDVCTAAISTTSKFNTILKPPISLHSERPFSLYSFVFLIIFSVSALHLIFISCFFVLSCHGKKKSSKWWFTVAFPGPLQIMARICFSFFLLFSFFMHNVICAVVVIWVYFFITHGLKPLSQQQAAHICENTP